MLRQKGSWSDNVEVVSEVSDVEQNRMALLGDSKKPDNSSATVEGPFFGFNLLEAKILIVGVKASQRRPAPCLVLSRGPLFYDSVDRFEDIGFELAFGMGRMGSGPVRMLLTGGAFRGTTPQLEEVVSPLVRFDNSTLDTPLSSSDASRFLGRPEAIIDEACRDSGHSWGRVG